MPGTNKKMIMRGGARKGAGRPREILNTVVLVAKVEASHKKALRQAASADGVTVGSVLRDLLEHWMQSGVR